MIAARSRRIPDAKLLISEKGLAVARWSQGSSSFASRFFTMLTKR